MALTSEQYSVLKINHGQYSDKNYYGLVILTNFTEELIDAIRATEGDRAYLQETDFEKVDKMS